MMRVGLFGAFAIDNTGDLLLALATQQALQTRAAVEVVLLAPVWPQPGWRQDFSRARGLGREILPVSATQPLGSHGLDAVIVCGGVIGTEPLFRPFLLEDFSGPAAWSAVCSQNTPYWIDEHRPRYEAIAAACRRLAYVSTRNHTTEHFLRRCGFDGGLAVVPDVVFGLAAPPSPTGRSPLQRPLVGWSPGSAAIHPRAAEFHADLIAWLQARLASEAIELVLFPFGGVYGDERVAGQIAAQLPRAQLLPPVAPLECWQRVGSLSFYLCARFHSAVAAIAQDVPFLVCDEYLSDCGTSKTRELSADLGLEPFYIAPSVATRPSLRAERLLGWATAGRVTFKPIVERIQRELAEHFDALCTALDLPRL